MTRVTQACGGVFRRGNAGLGRGKRPSCRGRSNPYTSEFRGSDRPL